MRLYLASSRLGAPDHALRRVAGGRRVAVVLNALDNLPMFPRDQWLAQELRALAALGLEGFELDLRRHDRDSLRSALIDVDLVWATGGNVFVLRAAMRESGLDSILLEGKHAYGGYSAGACVAGPTLRGFELVDELVADPTWDGLGLVDFNVAPHFRSEHPDAEPMESVIAAFERHGVPYRTLRDGEAIVLGMPDDPFAIRAACHEDHDALAALYGDMGDYYAQLAPQDFKSPNLSAFQLPPDAPGRLHLVAELDGQVIAAIAAVLVPPEDEHGIDPALAAPRMRIDFLATATEHRRTGAGTALVEAAEAWGRAHGARVAETWTYAKSPLSMPFWTQRAGYQPRSVILRKPL